MMGHSPKAKFKVLVCGATHTGKTSIIRRYIDNIFTTSFFPTILPIPSQSPLFHFSPSEEYASDEIPIKHTKKHPKSSKKNDLEKSSRSSPSFSENQNDSQSSFELSIWDTAGTEEYASMNPVIYHGVNAVVFVASYDDISSLTDIETCWVERISANTDFDKLIRILAINKFDIIRDQNEINEHIDTEKLIDDQSIERVQRNLNAYLFKVSAKDDINIRPMFDFIARTIWESNSRQINEYTVNYIDNSKGKNKSNSEKKHCC